MKSFLLSIPKGVPTLLVILLTLYISFSKYPFGIHDLKPFPYFDLVGQAILYFCITLIMILDYAKACLPHHSKLNKEIVIAAAASVLALVIEIWMDIRMVSNYRMSKVIVATIGAALAFLFYHFWLLHPFRHYMYHSIQHHWRYQHRRKKRK